MNRTGWLLCLGVLLAQSVCAHPFPTEQLGRFSELMIRRDGVDVKYTLSLTRFLLIEEIVTMNRDGDTTISGEEKKAYYSALRETLREGLSLTLDGRSIELGVTRGIKVDPPLNRVFHLRGSFAPLGGGKHRIVFSDQNYPKVPGPVEIIAKAGDEITLLSEANADLSKTYQEPKSADEGLGAFQIRELETLFQVGDAGCSLVKEGAKTFQAEKMGKVGETAERPPAAQPTLTGPSRRIDRLADRLFRGEIVGVRGTLLVFCTFVLLGAAHALTPGHGKTIVAAYLIGSKGRVGDAVFLGAVVTFTHTASVVVLGVIVHMLKNVFLPAKLNPFIASASGVLILVMGVCLIVSRARGRGAHIHDHDHGHDHNHNHDHDHNDDHPHHGEHAHGEHGAHDHGAEVTMAALLSLGIAGGIVPCPDALAVLLLAISFNHLFLGLGLLLAFSFGLAAVLIGIGVLLVTGRMKLPKGAQESKWVRIYLPVASAVLITILGAVMAVLPLVRSGVLTVRFNLPT